MYCITINLVQIPPESIKGLMLLLPGVGQVYPGICSTGFSCNFFGYDRFTDREQGYPGQFQVLYPKWYANDRKEANNC